MELFNAFTDFCACIGNLLTSKIELIIETKADMTNEISNNKAAGGGSVKG